MARKAKTAPVDEAEVFDPEAVEDTVIEAAPEPKSAPRHSARMLQLAADFGLGKEEAEEMSPDRLQDLIYNLTRHAAKASRERQVEQAQETDRRLSQEPAPVAQPAEEDDYAHLRGKWDDEIVNEFSKLAKKNKELEAGHQKFVAEANQRESQTYSNILDDSFADLGPQYERLLGSVGMSQLDPASPEAQRRRAIFSAAAIDFKQRPGARTVAQKIKAAAQMLLGHQIPPAPKPKETVGLYGEPTGETQPRAALPRDPATGRILPRDQVEQLEQAIDWATDVARPTHRKGANEPNGVAKATKSLEAKMHELSLASDGTGASGYPSKEDFL